MATRSEKDSLGTVHVPKDALYGAQTQRAVDNFPFGVTFPERFIVSLARVKQACAKVNADLGLLEPEIAKSIENATEKVAGDFQTYISHFPLSVFQTGSGTSTNMNMNEVISNMATQVLGATVHPNDHVNMSQSSNDIIPTTMNVAVSIEAAEQLIPALKHLRDVILSKAESVKHVVKNGRTHLMDAMPITMKQEMTGWAAQISKGIQRIESALQRTRLLAIGGTAVGTGINAHEEFGKRVTQTLSNMLGQTFQQNDSLFEALSAPDAMVEMSGQLKVIAVSLMKIANDLRWMNSGPIAGLGEIVLPALQPGSSIMPGKINPVIPEAVCMVAAQVIGNDATATVAGQSGIFQLNVMLPVLAYNVLQSQSLLTTACTTLADKAISGFQVNQEHMSQLLHKNPILVTALNPIVGYDLGAKVAKTAYAQGRSVKAVAAELTNLSQADLDQHLDPEKLTKGGIAKST